LGRVVIPGLREFDAVEVSGYCTSEGRFFYRLRGVIGDTSYGWQFKLWPSDSSIGDGKLWFRTRHAHVRLLWRGT
jgi:hypothetical protein